MVGCMCPTLSQSQNPHKELPTSGPAPRQGLRTADESRLSRCSSNLISSPALDTSITEDVMAAQSAVRAINTQDITAKAERDLLLLLEAVCKATITAARMGGILMLNRSEARRTWSLSVHWLVPSGSSSSSADFKNMAWTRCSSLRTTMSTPANGTWSSSSVERTPRKCER